MIKKNIFVVLKFILVVAVIEIICASILPGLGAFIGIGLGVYCAIFVKPLKKFVFGREDNNK